MCKRLIWKTVNETGFRFTQRDAALKILSEFYPRITAIKRLRLAGSVQIRLRRTSLNRDVIWNGSSISPSTPHCDREAACSSQPSIATDGARVLCEAGGGVGCWWMLPAVAIAVKIYNLYNIKNSEGRRGSQSIFVFVKEGSKWRVK